MPRKPKVKTYDFRDDVRGVLQTDLFSGKTPTFTGRLAVDDPDSAVHLILGDNGSGKSFLLMFLAAWAQGAGRIAMELSMSRRTRGGIERSFMYGSEEDHSTGLTSIGVVRRGIKSMRQWDKEHIALFDEPDTGLSDRLSHPLGRLIGQFAIEPASKTRGIAVVTHSRALIHGLTEELASAGRPYSVVLVGSRYQSFEEFMADTSIASIEGMCAAEDSSIEVWRAATKQLQTR